MKKCPNCGAVVPEAAFYCECGSNFYVHESSKPAPQSGNIPARTLKWDRVLFVIVALYLVITFVRRLFPIAEMPRRSETVLKILIELALAIGLIGLGTRILKAIPRKAHGRGKWLLLLVVGLISLLGIFAIHVTGGQRVEQAPRSRGVLADPSVQALGAEIEKMASRMKALVALLEKAQADLDKTRWQRTAETAPDQLRNLSREDLREYVAKQRALLDSIDRILQYLTESGFEAKFDRLFNLAKSQGLTAGRKRPDTRSWRILRQRRAANDELSKILEEHWEEWRLIESPQPEAELKPWQKEMNRLGREVSSEQLPEPASTGAIPPKK